MKQPLRRQPAVAGQFYPSNPDKLRSLINHFLGKATSSLEGELFGLICPHAGYVFSGSVAAQSFKLLENLDNIESVVVIGPSHMEGFTFSSVLTEGSYLTPLGEIKVDNALANAIVEAGSGQPDLIKDSSRGHDLQGDWGEHSIEVQLPFLQVIIPEIPFVPVVMGAHDLSCAQLLGETIADATGERKAVIIASSDLSHYHSYREARRLDGTMIRQVKSFNPEAISKALLQRETQACGSGPIMAAMAACRKLGANRALVHDYKTSADSPHGDHERVVGYMSASFEKVGKEKSEKLNMNSTSSYIPSESIHEPFELTTEQKRKLQQLAKVHMRSGILGDIAPPVRMDDPQLTRPSGAFVTIKKDNMLRGCIGFVESDRPMNITVAEAARAAATRDPRFTPLDIEEMEDITVEISILSGIKPISPDDVEPGLHGLWLIKGINRGLLLPQVATERGWDRETFLDNLCLKAGMPSGCWREKGGELFSFTAYIFSNKDLELNESDYDTEKT